MRSAICLFICFSFLGCASLLYINKGCGLFEVPYIESSSGSQSDEYSFSEGFLDLVISVISLCHHVAFPISFCRNLRNDPALLVMCVPCCSIIIFNCKFNFMGFVSFEIIFC